MKNTILKLYKSGMSIPEVSKETGVPRSSVRNVLSKNGVLRSRSEALRIASKKGKLGSGLRGKKRTFSKEHKMALSRAKKGVGRGFRKNSQGYIEYTMGENKGKQEHRVIVESFIGRFLLDSECVHHKDRNRSNNDISNLVIMDKIEHAKLHAKENYKKRTRDGLGRFI